MRGSDAADARLYRGFACPHEGLHADLLNVVVTEHSRGLCRAFLDRFSDHLERSSEGLSAWMSTWLEGPASFEDTWTLGAGRLRAVLREDSVDAAVPAATQFALDLGAHGVRGSWSVRVAPDDRLRWDRWLLPCSEELTIVSDGRVADLSAKQNGSDISLTLRRTKGTWSADRGQALPAAKLGRRALTVLMPRAFSGAVDADVQPRLIQGVPEDDITASLERAFALLRSSTPHYLTWVSGVLRGIIPLRMDGEMYVSGSHGDRPGVVTCSFPTPPEMLCELLVHECSHQYFLILTRLGDVHDGSDATLYYSPARRMDRPLFYILLAYHAVGNMLLFWQACRRSRLKLPDRCRERELELQDWARQLEPPLRASTALTPLGHALWQPLARRLRLHAA